MKLGLAFGGKLLVTNHFPPFRRVATRYFGRALCLGPPESPLTQRLFAREADANSPPLRRLKHPSDRGCRVSPMLLVWADRWSAWPTISPWVLGTGVSLGSAREGSGVVEANLAQAG